MENDRIAIVGGVRTPFAKAFTDLTDLNASDLAKLTTQELIQRLALPPEVIDEVIWGAVLSTMTNLNVGREVAIALGLAHAPGFTLARQCATGIQQAQVVIEAVFEDLDPKRRVMADLEALVPPETVIASNTSSIPITVIAERADHPERIISMHFFSPVEKMPLLEIITSTYTDEQTLATAVALGRKLGKTVIVVKDSPGFFVNRILTPYLNEAFKLLEDGIAVDELDRAARHVGFPVGPCALLDEVGLDVAGKVSGVMAAFIGERLELTDYNRRFTEDNRLGRKNGRGFYAYENGKKGKVDESAYQLFENPRRRGIAYEEVWERLLAGILNEAAYALEEGIIDSASVGDAGAIYGFGFPPFLGGPYWAIDRIGLTEFVIQLLRLENRHGSRFAPAPGLVDRAEAGEGYHAAL